MRTVVLDALVLGVAPAEVFAGVTRFERYAELAPHVQSTQVHQGPPEPTGRSSWELHFRSGLLNWTEVERFLPEQLIIEFEQVNGDFDEFSGRWTLRETPEGTEVHFEAGFDFGIPSLEGILDPIAERVIRETVAWALVGLFRTVRLNEESIYDSALIVAQSG